MSYADNTLRPRKSPGSSGAARGGDAEAAAAAAGRATAADEHDTDEIGEEEDDQAEGAEGPTEAEGEPFVDETDWQRVGIFGAGLAIGALLGAGAALLLAPQSGAETRDAIVTRVLRVRDRAGDAWGDLGDELRRAARRGRKRVRRGITRGRWKAADAIDRD